MQRRRFLKSILASPLLGLLRPSTGHASEALKSDVTNIAFGSCCNQDLAQPIWDVIRNQRPDFFAFIGDNIYADTDDMQVMKAKYQQLGRNPQFLKFRQEIPIIATWDDHDYGINDGGSEYIPKQQSKELMLNFFREPSTSIRWKREGVYTSYFGGPHQRLQVILLDLRWFRSSLISDENGYVANPDPTATMLGSEQWKWLEQQLRMPAEIRILFSSTQFISSDHGWEKWANFPFEKARLLKMIDQLNVRNLIIASGDMHYGELSKEVSPGGIELFDLTSSGLNFVESGDGIPNTKRISLFDSDCNYGWITIDWRKSPRRLRLEVRNSFGQSVISQEISV